MSDLPYLNYLERRLLKMLAGMHKNGPARCHPGRAALARKFNVGERTISRALSILVAGGYIERVSRGPRSSLYVVFGAAFGNPSENGAALQIVPDQLDTAKCGAAVGAAFSAYPYIKSPPTPLAGNPILIGSLAIWEEPQIHIMQMPVCYANDPEAVRLWDLARLWISGHPEIDYRSRRAGSVQGFVAQLMHALEASGIQTPDQLSGFTWDAPVPKKPAASEQSLILLRKALVP